MLKITQLSHAYAKYYAGNSSKSAFSRNRMTLYEQFNPLDRGLKMAYASVTPVKGPYFEG